MLSPDTKERPVNMFTQTTINIATIADINISLAIALHLKLEV
jgi:hypothetical protein